MNDRALHTRIRADISERILSGAWPPGQRVPSAHDLMGQSGGSRRSVNKARGPLAGVLARCRRVLAATLRNRKL